LYSEQWRASTNDLAKQADKLFKKDAEISEYYNTKLAGGKWKNMMNQTHIGYTYWQQPDKNSMPEVNKIELSKEALLGVTVEGTNKFTPSIMSDLSLPTFDPFNKQSYFIELFQRGDKSVGFTMTKNVDWIKLSETKGKVDMNKRIFVEIDWSKVSEGENNGIVTINGTDGSVVNVNVLAVNFPADQKKLAKGFIENNGCISIEAAHFSRNVGGNIASWKEIPGLGRTLSAMHPVPVTAAPQTPKMGGPVLEYDFNLLYPGEYSFNLFLSPTLNIYNDEGLEVAVSIDEGVPVILNMHKGRSFQDWEESVKNNMTMVTTKQNLESAGNHTLKVWMVDPGVVLEKILIETGDHKKSYLGAPESFCKKE
jgi:hypothetical protein